MARMIPADIYGQCASPGEEQMFKQLRDDPATAGWVVLHSLDIVNHREQITGEIDFVVIIPAKGVLFIEVKAHQYIDRRDGKWFFGLHDQRGETRGPFKQVSSAMQSLRGRVNERLPGLKGLAFGSCVVFTHCEFNKSSEEWHDWQIIDAKKFGKFPISQLLLHVMEKWRELFASAPTGGWFRPALEEPTREQVEALTNYLRPNFEVYESPKAQAGRRAEELKRFTDEQFKAIDQMSDNPRVFLLGPAGTGKTLLAIEAARRAAANNRRVLFLCFNKQLGQWLEQETEPLKPLVKTSTLHKYMLEVTGQNETGAILDSQYWSDELPDAAALRLLEGDNESFVFDELIVDEAQDLFRSKYLEFLDLSVQGGITGGRWRVFGDFEKQAIYNADSVVEPEALSPRFGFAPILRLRDNCRNKPRIAEMVHLLGGLKPGYSRVLRPDDGQDPKLLYYKDGKEQQEILINALADLYREGFGARDIAVLSPRRPAECAAAQIKISPWKERLRPFAIANDTQIKYSSIHAFKGLEAGAIIVTDLESISDASDLFYVAVTRALHKLILIIDDAAKMDVIQTLTRPEVPVP